MKIAAMGFASTACVAVELVRPAKALGGRVNSTATNATTAATMSALIRARKICFDFRRYAAVGAALARGRLAGDHARHRACLGLDVSFALRLLAPRRQHEAVLAF